MNYLVVIVSQKNGEMVCCLWSWRIKISVNKNTKRLTFTNGVFLTEMLTLNGFNPWILSWTIIKCWLLSQMIVFLSLHQWDYFLKSPILKMQLQLQYQEEVCSLLTRLTLVGNLLLTVGLIDLNLTWRQMTMEFYYLSHQLTKSQKQYSSDASNLTLRHLQIWWT